METTNHLLRSFKQLLNKHYATKHMVADYADMLVVTSDYLNKTVNPHNRKIGQRTYSEQTYYRSQSVHCFSVRWSNKELSYELGFDESAHFNNFFQKPPASLLPSFVFRQDCPDFCNSHLISLLFVRCCHCIFALSKKRKQVKWKQLFIKQKHADMPIMVGSIRIIPSVLPIIITPNGTFRWLRVLNDDWIAGGEGLENIRTTIWK